MAKKGKANKGGESKLKKAEQRREEKQQKKDKSQKKASGGNPEMSRNIVVAALIIILLLAGIGFLIFGLVQSLSEEDNDNGNDTAQEQVDEENGSEEGNGEEANGDEANGAEDNGAEADGSEERDEQDLGSVEGEADSATDTGEGNVNEDAPGASTEAAATEGLVAGRFERTDVSYSRGNDYSFGDISGNTYTIKRGDTLWQIAEGRYGSGLAWTEINEANGGFKLLPNGTPVFLRVGEQITLPDLD